ncbi:MAG: CRISPR-associated endonuclease Cas3'', partial [Pontiella sp.]
MTRYFAHSNKGDSSGWQPLEEHLASVAKLAAQFAAPFGGEDWAHLAGLWHDLGKYHPDFQRKLRGESLRIVHSEAGGHLASLKGWRTMDVILSWLIMGHHAGLADYGAGDTGGKALEPKMRKPERSAPVLANVPAAISDQNPPAMPPLFADQECFPDLA